MRPFGQDNKHIEDYGDRHYPSNEENEEDRDQVLHEQDQVPYPLVFTERLRDKADNVLRTIGRLATWVIARRRVLRHDVLLRQLPG
jgi:hypothetical protein